MIFPLLNDFHEWGAWSPWEKLDPAMKRAGSKGPASGVGAEDAWAGDKNIGEGKMTIEESTPGALLRVKLEFIRPFAAINEAKFILAPADGGTKVTWTMDGPANFISKTMSLFMDMETMIGGAFEQGLADLDKTAQAKLAGAK